MPAFDVPRFVRMLMIIALAWGGPASALALGRVMKLRGGSAVALAFFGGAAAVGLAFASARTGSRKPSRPRSPATSGSSSGWEALADPHDHYASRWAMYESLSGWLGGREWKGRSVVEFGHANPVLRAFMEGAEYRVLDASEHDVQRLDRVSAGEFDAAILDQTLARVSDPDRALSELRRVLKPGGVAIVITPFLAPAGSANDVDSTRWTPRGLQALLTRGGFESEVNSWGNLPAARELLGSMEITAADAMARRLGIRRGDNDTSYPVTVWAIATAKN